MPPADRRRRAKPRGAVRMSVSIQWVILAALFMVSAFCSSSESVFFSLDPMRLRRLTQRHPAVGARIHALLARPTRVLSTILILNTAVNIGAAMVGYRIALRLISPRLAEPVSIAVFTLLLLLFGEYGPKHLALMFTERMAVAFEPPLRALVWLMTPVRWLLERATRGAERFFRPLSLPWSKEDIAASVTVGGQEGIIDAEEYSMIQAIIGLEDKSVQDVMRPRTDLMGLDLDSDAEGFLDHVRRARRRHLLLYRGVLENVEGFLDCRRFLLDPEHRVEAARLPPYFISEHLPLNRLLLQFQQERRRIAVVVDEYGSVSGVVTRGDILEEISGEIYQELSKPRPVFMESGPNRWIIDAAIPIEDINRRLNLTLEAGDSDLLSGWLAYHAGHVPAEGEALEAQGIRATVLKADRSRVTMAQVQRLEAAS